MITGAVRENTRTRTGHETIDERLMETNSIFRMKEDSKLPVIAKDHSVLIKTMTRGSLIIYYADGPTSSKGSGSSLPMPN